MISEKNDGRESDVRKLMPEQDARERERDAMLERDTFRVTDFREKMMLERD